MTRTPSMSRLLIVVLGLILTASPSAVLAQGPYIGVSRPADIRELAFAVRGKVAEVFVSPGDRIEAGAMLIRLDDAVQRANHALASAQAEDETGIELARLAVAFQTEQLEITEQSAAQGGANSQDLREARFAKNRAEVELRSAIIDLEQRRLSLEREAASLSDAEAWRRREGGDEHARDRRDMFGGSRMTSSRPVT